MGIILNLKGDEINSVRRRNKSIGLDTFNLFSFAGYWNVWKAYSVIGNVCNERQNGFIT